MNYSSFIFSFLILTFSTYCKTKQYDLSYLGENLFLYSSEQNYLLYEKTSYNINIKLIKKLQKEVNDISIKNYLIINDKEEKEVDFEDVGSFYEISDNKIIICPRGKYHPFEYDNNFKEKIPINFKENGNWDLRCYKNKKEEINIIYLMNGKNTLYKIKNDNYILEDTNIYFDELYDLIKENNKLINYIGLRNGYIELFNSKWESDNQKIITKAKLYSQANIDNNENIIYFFTYNNSSDFISGYVTLNKDIGYNLIDININNESPFNFYKFNEIKEINFFCNNNRYIYYKIYNKITEKFNYGIIDIISNKIIFNINEDLYIFKPFINDSMLAITLDYSAYKILIIENGLSENIQLNSLFNLNAINCYELCKNCTEKSTKETDQKCTSCITGFSLKNGNCFCPGGKEKVGKTCNPCSITTCLIYTQNKCTCTRCPEGYYLNSTKYCVPCISPCKTCSSSAVCKTCINNYFLISNKCYECNKNCKTTVDGCKCNSCNDGFYLSNSQCLPCDSTCKTCSVSAKNCTNCKDGYYLNSNNQCIKCQIGCKTCEGSADYCLNCIDGYYRDSTKCYRCISPCETCSSSTKCLSCVDKYFIINDKCYECNKNCKTTIDGCKCKTCNDGFYLSYNQCLNCDDNCKTCEGSANKCRSCKDGYYLDINTNTCIKCSPPCKTCSSETSCLSCIDKYFNINDKCYKCNMDCKTTINGCKCATCNDGYYLSNYQCKRCDDNCETCEGSGDYCLSCKDGLFIQKNKCYICDKNCRTCEGNDKNCIDCNSGAFLYGNECLNCATSCTTFDQDECKCLICNKNYQNFRSQCLSCPSLTLPCLSYKINTCNCNSCQNGFYLDNDSNICNKCDNNCKTCEKKANLCTNCSDNYFLDNNHCYKCTECKEKQDNSCKCISCKDGTYLNKQHQCANCTNTCKKCEEFQSKCTDCYEGYFLKDNQCVPCFNRCKKCDSHSENMYNQHCISCLDNYVYLDGNCLEECPEGYYLEENEKICQKCNEHCGTCIIKGNEQNENCLSCNGTSKYKYLVNATGFGNNCVNACPSGTKLSANNTCVLSVLNSDEENNKENIKNLVVIISSSISGLVIIGIAIYLIYLWKKKKETELPKKVKYDETLIENINKDLGLYQSFD